MSDSSDGELTNLTNNIYQNSKMVVSASGPSFKGRVFSFGNNVLSSTMQMPRNFERQRYAESEYGQTNPYRRRQNSPMSIMSACDMRQRNFNNYSRNADMMSQKSFYNGRAGSPMSVRSIDSTCSRISAVDIAAALRTMDFSNCDRRLISEACRKFMKRKYKNKRGFRRHVPYSLKGPRTRRRSGYDSGAQASDSSISSDDISNRTSNYKENMSCRSTRTDMSDLRRNYGELDVHREVNGLKHNMRSLGGPINFNMTQTSVTSYRSDMTNSNMPANFKNMQRQNGPNGTLRDRFRSGIQLPSQRFNKSVASSTIPEYCETANFKSNNNKMPANTPIESDSEFEDIFSACRNKRQNVTITQRKRSIDEVEEVCLPQPKKAKVTPKKMEEKSKKKTKDTAVNNKNSNDFVFAKPLLPVRKSSNLKNKEQLISRSSTLSETVQSNAIEKQIVQDTVEQEKEKDVEDDLTLTKPTSDVSMRPSFIKRKLFTQNLDVAEQKNSSSDNLSDSPQSSIYGKIQNERKARKLQQVTTQSCLSRDVGQDESNLLDLIHKIVPPDQMNVTNQTNKTDVQSKNRTEESVDKWDISSIIDSRKTDQNESDTYTDEEIFNMTVKENAKEVPRHVPCQEKKQMEPKVVIDRLPAASIWKPKPNVQNEDIENKSIQKSVRTFWETDFESDAEVQPPRKNSFTKETQKEDHLSPEPFIFRGFGTKFNNKKIRSNVSNSSMLSYTFDTLPKFNSTSLKMKSHRATKRKDLNQTREDSKLAFEPQTKKQKTTQVKNHSELSKTNKKTDTNKNKSEETKPRDDKSKTKQKKLTKEKESEFIPEKPVKPVSANKKPGKTTQIVEHNKQIEAKNKQNKNDKTKTPKKTVNTKKSSRILETPKKTPVTKKQDKSNKNKENESAKKYSKPHDVNGNKLSNKAKEPEKCNTKNKKSPKSKKESTLKNCTNQEKTEDNKGQRSIRSCRHSKLNQTQDKSNISLNGTMSRSLRSRQIDLSPKNITKGKQKSSAKETNPRLSDVSFSLAAKKNPKRAVSKLAKTFFNDTSDVSFSLQNIESPTPKKSQFDAKSKLKGKNVNGIKKFTPIKRAPNKK